MTGMITTPALSTVTVDQDRLWESLMMLAQTGAYDDVATGLVGVNRQSLTDTDRAGRQLVVSWLEDAGLQVRIDRMGNVVGRGEGTDPDAAAVLAASHIDSVATAGRISLDHAYALVDAAGLRFGDELDRIEFRGDVDVALPPPHAYVECPIEQGPVLAAEGSEIGVVPGVQAIAWQKVTLHGRAAHAGTTPTELTVDLRNPDDTHMAAAEADLAAFLGTLDVEQPGLRVETARMAKTHQGPFDADIQAAVAAAADDLGYTHRSLMSGAGHDAQEIAAIAPAEMIFIPGDYDGISHNPREYSTPAACTRGINVLATTLLRLAGRA